MGWGRTLLLGDIGNRLDIEDTERDIASLKREIAGSFQKDMSQDEMIGQLIAENAQLKLYFASLVRLLVRKGSISKDELAAVVAAVDAEDGRVDGQFTGKVV
jgi:multidrug resistance efflux pump